MSSATDIKRPFFARTYPKAAARAERRGATEHRRRLLAGLSGRVVELGAGNGLNFAHYPTAVTEVVAIEPEPSLRTAAEQAAQLARVRVARAGRIADRLPLDRRRDGRGRREPRPVLASPTRPARWPSCTGCCAPAASSASTSTSSPRCQPRRMLLQARRPQRPVARDRGRLPPGP